MLVFAPRPRGLEELLVAEFSTLGLTKVAAVGGGVQAEASQALCIRPTCIPGMPRVFS